MRCWNSFKQRINQERLSLSMTLGTATQRHLNPRKQRRGSMP
jgi:hypothetical protein